MRKAYLDYIQRDGCPILVRRFHVSLQIDVQKLKDQVQFLVSMNDVQKPAGLIDMRHPVTKVGGRLPDDVFIPQFLQETDFTNGSAGHALIFCL